MKKTIKISLQGAIFYIDEDAYAMLQQYLTEIGDYFKNREEADEILQDIETRIAEIFTERLAGKREVITLPDIEQMISVLGRPEDIFGGQEQEEDSSAQPVTGQRKRRLYRDPENSVLGGVCGGLGTYFDVDPVWFRVLFILLTLAYGASVLIYLVMWLVIPEARTATQRLEMQGKQVNIANISKNVNDEFVKVRESIKNFPKSEGYRRSRNSLQEFFHVLGQIIMVILKIIAVTLGVIFILFGIIILVSLLSVFFFHYSRFLPELNLNPSYYLPDLLAIFTKPENVPYIIGTFILTLGIPLIALIYAGIKIIFRIQTRYRAVGITLFVIWLISFISLSLFVGDIGSNFSERARTLTSSKINLSPSDTLYLSASVFANDQIEKMITLDYNSIYLDKTTDLVMGKPEVEIYYSDNVEKPEVEIYRKAHATNREQALRRCEKIQFTYQIKNNHLFIDPWFGTGKTWYAQEVEVRLRLPEGTLICLDKDLRYLLNHIPNQNDYWGYDMAGKCWMMTRTGLKLAE